MGNVNHDSVNELITRHLAGETSVDEEKSLSLWIAESEDNRRHYHALKKTFDISTGHLQLPVSDNLNIDVEAEWGVFRQRVGMQGKIRQLSPVRVWLGVAASLLLILTAGAILYYFTYHRATVFQTMADTKTVTLPDGSRVTLNRHTLLSYTADFNKKARNVMLEGEAFFEVTPNGQRPFVVLSGNARVRVIGTSFNITAYDSLNAVEVVVETGIVSLEPAKGAGRAVEILPGEKGVISKSDNRMSIAVNEDINFRAWSTGHLVFVDTDLLSVIRVLEKTYNVQISMTTDIPSSCIVTVTFDGQSLESVMRVLENTLNLRYNINGNKVEITEAGC